MAKSYLGLQAWRLANECSLKAKHGDESQQEAYAAEVLVCHALAKRLDKLDNDRVKGKDVTTHHEAYDSNVGDLDGLAKCVAIDFEVEG